MVKLRALQWPDDREGLLALDTAFTTDRIYRVVATERSFGLETVVVTPPFHKAYDLNEHMDYLPDFHHVVIAEVDTRLAGMAALRFEAWNRRAVLWHLYVAPVQRGRGVGRRLMEAVIQTAQTWQARCVWLETQNVNYGAIQFYSRLGFVWCGLDLALYDPHGPAAGETALFFARSLA
jgi:ribosomal protein S18 acetylase RimI-like enzyme